MHNKIIPYVFTHLSLQRVFPWPVCLELSHITTAWQEISRFYQRTFNPIGIKICHKLLCFKVKLCIGKNLKSLAMPSSVYLNHKTTLKKPCFLKNINRTIRHKVISKALRRGSKRSVRLYVYLCTNITATKLFVGLLFDAF